MDPRSRRWRITPRDVEVLRFLTLYGIATAEQVRREFFGGSVKAAYRRLGALQDHGLLKGERVFYRMPAVYRSTEAGAKLADVDLPSCHLDLARLHHSLEVLELSWKLRSVPEEYPDGGLRPSSEYRGDEITLFDGAPEDTPEGAPGGTYGGGEIEDWITEREMRRDKLSEKREKETGRMIRTGARLGRIPDGIAILHNGQEVAIELELTPKRAVNYHRIFSDYEEQVGSGEVDAVRFYFTSQRAMGRVAALSERHDLLDGFLEFRVYRPVFEKRR